MTEALQVNSYPSQTCGPVLVPAPAPSSLPIILNSSSNEDNGNLNRRMGGRSIRTTSRQRMSSAVEEECRSYPTGPDSHSHVTSPTPSSSTFRDDMEHDQFDSSSSTGDASMTASAGQATTSRTQAVAQRMERKKTREKMRRLEVNDKFNELMEALAEVEAEDQTPLEQQQQKKLQQVQAGNADKGNFRVDVLSRAVKLIKRLQAELKAEHTEVERLRAQMEQKCGPVKEEEVVDKEWSGHEERQACHSPSGALSGREGENCVMPTVSSQTDCALASKTLNHAWDAPGNKGGPPVTWVRVPLWMPSGGHSEHTERQAAIAHMKGMMLDHQVLPAGNAFPFAAMPFLMPSHNDGDMSAVVPGNPGSFAGGDGSLTGQSSTAGFEGVDEAPTHAPCA